MDSRPWLIQAHVSIKLLIIRKGSDLNIVDTYLKEMSKSIVSKLGQDELEP